MFGRAVRIGLIALAVATGQVAAQARQVTGTVTKAGTKQPVAEATVAVVGGTASARTNAQGHFQLDAPAGELKLSVRAIGYQRKELLLPAGQTSVDVSLSEDIFKLDEVVTTGQATSIEKRNATTATVNIDKEDLVRAPAQSLDQALQGKTPGAQVFMNGGGPGGGAQIQIRGASSILGNSQPLFVLDGTIISNDAFSGGSNAVSFATGASGVATSNQDNAVNRLSDLNPNEIESIEILKSAAATAIYGSRATNGVVVIKTKRGQAGATRLNLTQRIGTQEPLRLLGNRTFTSVDQVTNVFTGNGNSGGAAAYLAATFPTGVIPASANVDFGKQFFNNTKPSYETVANLSGGTDKFQYFTSLGNKQEVGLAPNTGARLQSFRFNADQKLGKLFSASISSNISRNVLNRGISGNDNSCASPVYCQIYTPNVFDPSQKDANGVYVRNPFGLQTSNWFDEFERLKNTQSIFRQNGNASVTFKPVENATHRVALSVNGGMDHYVQDAFIYSPADLQYEGFDGFRGRVYQGTTNGLNYNAQTNAVWTFTGWKTASFTTSVGAAIERQETNFYDILARGLLPGQVNIQQGTAPIATTQAFQKFRDQAIFANEQILALDDKLSITAGVRADRSSANGDQSKFYVFPRGGAAYNFGNLGFVSSLKLRGAVGRTGNRPRYGDRDIQYNGILIDGSTNALSGIIVPTSLGNPSIKPETLTEYEGGAEITFLNDRLQFEGTYFQRNITDLLLNPAVATSSGYSNVVVNAGKLQTKGVELALNTIFINQADLQWTLRTSFQKTRQRVLDLPATIPPFSPSGGNAGSTRPRIVQGQITTDIWGNIPYVNGVAQPVGYVYLKDFTPGGASLAAYTPLDSIIDDANPKFQMFFNNSVTWKKLTLGFTVDWRQGGGVFNFTQSEADNGGTSKDFDDPVTLANAPRGTTAAVIAALPAGTKLGEFRFNAWSGGRDARVYTQDGGFVRVRDLSLSYDLGKRAAQYIGGNSLRVSLQGRNLLMWTKYTAFDPENVRRGSQNIRQAQDLSSFPGARQFFLSVDVGF